METQVLHILHNKEDYIMSDNVPNTTTDGTVSPWVVLVGVGGAVLAISSLIHSGYEMGISQSRKILKRHDKAEKIKAKEWKRYFKQQEKEKKLNAKLKLQTIKAKQKAKGSP
jgi:hypothetical protein